MIVIGFASIFGWIATTAQFHVIISNVMATISSNPYIIYIILVAVLLIIGMFIEGLAAMLILVPTLVPLAAGLNYDPIHFALVVLLCLGIGSLTPPVGRGVVYCLQC